MSFGFRKKKMVTKNKLNYCQNHCQKIKFIVSLFKEHLRLINQYRYLEGIRSMRGVRIV